MRVYKDNGSKVVTLGEAATFAEAGKLVANDYYGKTTPKTDTYEIRAETARDALRNGEQWFGRGNNRYYV